jgi:3-hydroxyacyl-[acyl-carrier-protein] dehydratase
MTKPADTLRWTVPLDHPSLAGHFPGRPMVPGVLLLDCVLHGLATTRGLSLDNCTISSLKFFSPARPGDEIVIDYEIAADGLLRFAIARADDAAHRIASGALLTGHSA